MASVQEIKAEIAVAERAVRDQADAVSQAAKAKRVAEQRVSELKDELLDALLASVQTTTGKK